MTRIQCSPAKIVQLTILACLTVTFSIGVCLASEKIPADQREALQRAVRGSTDQIWFQQNVGQFPQGVRYGFRTSFGQTLVYDDHLQLISRQMNAARQCQGQQIVDIRFTSANVPWTVAPGDASSVSGSYHQADGTTLTPDIFKEVTLRNVYDGVDLRLYSADKGTLEFDWIVSRAQDYEQIRIAVNGQDGLAFSADGSATLNLRYQNLSFRIPESFQVINGEKKPVLARMVPGDNTAEIRYVVEGDLVSDEPLVIDPNVVWATYIDLNDGATPFDSYLYAVAINGTGVYCLGWLVETLTNGSFGNYMEVNAGFSQGTVGGQNYIYRLSTDGLHVTAWTGTGIGAPLINGNQQNTVPPTEIELFPDGRVLASYSNGALQIYSADLATQSYTGTPQALSTINSLAIVDNNSFYVGGLVTAAIPALVPAGSGLDTTFAGTSEGIIVRYTLNAGTPVADWATYIGGDNTENFCAIALTPNTSKLCFAVHSDVGANYPAVKNAVDATATGTTVLLIGVINDQAAKPAAFDVFSFLGGSGNDGLAANKAAACVLTTSNTGFWVAGNTSSVDFPGVTVASGGKASGAQTTNAGGTTDCFISFIPLNGSASMGFQSTYVGGTGIEVAGGVVYDALKDRVLLFGTTTGAFPTVDTTPPSNYYVNTFAGGTYDIFIATYIGDLTVKDYATYIGGNGNDYLGDTGLLRGTGHVKYSTVTDQVYLATTVHSVLPASIIGTPPGKDKGKSNAANDTHVIFAFTINQYDHGDAPASYEGGDPGAEAISNVIRIGATVDAEFAALSSPLANGDDLKNDGSPNDEDGITLPLPTLNYGDSTYSVNVSVLNNTGAPQTLQGWIDFNRDGIFEANERTTVSVPANAAQQTVTLTWNALPVLVPGNSFLRLRFSDNLLTDNVNTPIDERAIGTDPTGHGEIEDYLLPIVAADLSVAKDDGSPTYTAGTDISYTITVNTAGPSDAQSVQLSDPLPAGTTFVSLAVPAGWARTDVTAVGANGTITATIPTLVNGAAPQVFTLVVHVKPNTTGNLANTATVTTTTPDPIPGNNTVTDTDTPNPKADIQVTKTGAASVLAGSNLTYTVTIVNNGPSDAQTVALNDPLPAGTTFVSQSQTSGPAFAISVAGNTINDTIATLTAGSTAVFSVVVNVNSNVSSGTTVTNSATGTSTTPDPTPPNNTSTTMTNVTTSADLGVTKTVDIATPILGTNVNFTITLTNIGPSDATNVVVNDLLPAGLTLVSAVPSSGSYNSVNGNWSVASLVKGASVTLAVRAAASTIGAKTNTATIKASDQTDSNPLNDSASVTVTPQYPDLSILKTDNVASAKPGDTLTYVLTYQNKGNRDASAVVLTETVPANCTFVAAGSTPGWTVAGANMTLAVGTVTAGAAARTATFVVKVNAGVPAGTSQIVNTVSIDDDHTNGIDPNPADNTATDTDNLTNALPDYAITKDDGQLQASPNQLLIYNIKVTNNGNKGGTNVKISETIPANSVYVAASSSAGWTFANGAVAGTPGSLTLAGLAPSGASTTVQLAVRVLTPLPAGTKQIVNTATVDDDHANGVDPNFADNTATDTDAIGGAAPDYAITKDDAQTNVTPGQVLTYAIKVTNNGNIGGTNVKISETIPPNTTFVAAGSSAGWTFANGAAAGTSGSLTLAGLAGGGANTTVQLVLKVNATILAGSNLIVNTVSVDDDHANGLDPNFADNTASDTDTIINVLPDYALTKDDGQANASPNQLLIYNLKVTNNGTKGGTNVKISETIPANTVFVAASSSAGWTFANGAAGGTAGSLTLAGLAGGGANTTVQFAVRVLAALPPGTKQIVNTASVDDDHANGVDPNFADNSATDTDAVAGAVPDYAITKNDGQTNVVPGQLLVYAIQVTNNGSVGGTNVKISETIPANTTFVSASSSAGWTFANGDVAGTAGSLTLASLAGGGANTTVQLAVRVNATILAGSNSIVNTVSVDDDHANGLDPNFADNTASDTDTIINVLPDYAITKDDGQANATTGQLLIYNIKVTNNGLKGGTNVKISETIPANTVFVAASSSAGWTFGNGAVGGTAGSLTLAGLAGGGANTTVQFAVRVNTPLPAGSKQISNTVTVDDDHANGVDPNFADNTATDTDPLANVLPDYAITKDDGQNNASPNQLLIYNIKVTNNGNIGGTNVKISETIPANTVFVAASSSGGWTFANGAAGGTAGSLTLAGLAGGGANTTVQFAVRVLTPLPAGTKQIANTVTVDDDHANGVDPNFADNTATDTDNVAGALPDYALLKNDSQLNAVPGQVLIYAIQVTNNGSIGGTNVKISETIPANTTFVAASSSAGWTFANGDVGGTAGSLTLAGLAGGGASTTVQLAVKVGNPLPAGTKLISNTASVDDDHANGLDPNFADNSASDVDNVITAPDYAITKDDGQINVVPGQVLIYNIKVTNNGNAGGTNVKISETIPPNTTFVLASSSAGWTFANGAGSGTAGSLTLAGLAGGGANTTVQLALKVNATIPAGSNQLVNTVSVDDDHANGVDPNFADNTASDTDTITGVLPDYAITKDDGQTIVAPGQLLIYSLVVTNHGNKGGTNVKISETIPVNTTYVAASSSAGWSFANGAVAGTAGSLIIPGLAGGGGTTTVQLAVRVNATIPPGSNSIPNTASVDDDHVNGVDPNFADNSATDTDTVAALPDYAITKDDGVLTATTGQVLIYNLKVTNNGKKGGTNVKISETIPANTVFVAASSSAGWTFANGDVAGTAGSLTLPVLLGGGANTTVQFAVRVGSPLPAGATQIVNTASVDDDHANGVDPNFADNSASDTDAVAGTLPNYALTKDDGQASATPGQLLVYNIKVTNNGNIGGTNVKISETIPANTAYVAASSSAGWTFANGDVGGTAGSLTLPGLAGGGANTTVQLAVRVLGVLPAGVTQIVNTASVDDDHANGIDPNFADNSASDTDPIAGAAPDLSITKDDGLTTVVPGQTVVYTLTVTNLGNVGSTGVTITETVPANTVFVAASSDVGWNFVGNSGTFVVGALPVGNISTVKVAFKVNATVPSGVTTIANTATVDDDHANGIDPNPGNNSATDTDALAAAPDLAIVKDDGVTIAIPGQTLVYSLTVSNKGDQDATGVTIKDSTPANTVFDAVNSSVGWSSAGGTQTFTLGNLAAGQTTVVKIAFKVNATVPAGVTTVVNTATVGDDGTNGPDKNPADNTSTDIDTLTAQPDLAVVKDDGVAACSPGQTLTYTLTVSNHGNQDATGVTITETVPANTTFVAAGSSAGWLLADGAPAGTSATAAIGALAAGTSTTLTFVLKVNASIASGVTQIANTATVTDDGSNGPDPTPGDNTSTDTDALTAQPNLKIVKTDGGVTVLPGHVLIYTLAYSNIGNKGASGVVVNETVPANMTFVAASSTAGWSFADGAPAGTAGTFTIGNVAPGASGTILLAARLNASIPPGTLAVSNTAKIGDDGTNGPDPDPTDNTSTVSTHIPTSDIQVAKTVNDPTPKPLEVVTYTITVRNLGPDDTTGVSLIDVLPKGLTFISAAPSRGTYDNASGLWTIGALKNTEAVTLSVAARVEAGNTGTTIMNIALKTTSDNWDPDPSNDTSKQPVVPRPCPTIVFNSPPTESPNPAVQGQVVSFFAAAADSDNDPLTYSWNFGDGTPAVIGQAPTHVYASPGPFTVTCTCSNGCSTAADTLALTIVPLTCDALRPAVKNPPSINATFTQSGLTYSFNAVANDVEDGVMTQVAWNFGDGSYGFGVSPVHTYAGAGVFFVTARVQDSDGNCRETVIVVNPSIGTLTTGLNNVLPMSCTFLRVGVNFGRANSDTLTLLTQIDIPTGFKAEGQPITIQVAGMRVDAVLDSRLRYRDATRTIQVKYIGGHTVIELKIVKGDIKGQLGVLANADLSAQTLKGIGLMTSIGGNEFIGSADLVFFSARNGKGSVKK